MPSKYIVKTLVDPFIIYDFYKKLADLYKDSEVSEGKGSFTFNCVEGGFRSSPCQLKVIGQKGKPLNRVLGSSGKESTTVLICVSAERQFLLSLIVKEQLNKLGGRQTMFIMVLFTQLNLTVGWKNQFFCSWFESLFICHVKK